MHPAHNRCAYDAHPSTKFLAGPLRRSHRLANPATLTQIASPAARRTLAGERNAGMDFDLFVIGGGSAGVRCARISAGYGARVAIAEERFWGGTCVNVGCVPKKLMVMAAEYGHAVEDSHGFGWDTAPGHHDWSKLIAAKD